MFSHQLLSENVLVSRGTSPPSSIPGHLPIPQRLVRSVMSITETKADFRTGYHLHPTLRRRYYQLDILETRVRLWISTHISITR